MLFKSELELANGMEWNLVRRGDFIASPGPDPNSWFPINPIAFTTSERILMIGVENQDAKPKWWLGAYFSANLLISPSSVTKFLPVVEFHSERLPVNKLKLIIVPDMGAGTTPYMGILKIPRWYDKMWVEIWYYSGKLSTEVEEKLTQMQAKLNSL